MYILTLSDMLSLQTDASGVGMGAVMNTIHDRKELPVTYYSQKLTAAERQSSGTELEGGLVVVTSTLTHTENNS